MLSQNGYTAFNPALTQIWEIGDKRVRIRLRMGSPGFLLVHFANWFDHYVQDIDAGQLDDWGYAERPIRGAVAPSNHASGTAIDINATKWPLGSDATVNLTLDKINMVHAKLKEYEGAIRWGQDYVGRQDPMHFEINKPEDFCDYIARKIQSPITVGAGEEEMRIFRDSETGGIYLVTPKGLTPLRNREEVDVALLTVRATVVPYENNTRFRTVLNQILSRETE